MWVQTQIGAKPCALLGRKSTGRSSKRGCGMPVTRFRRTDRLVNPEYRRIYLVELPAKCPSAAQAHAPIMKTLRQRLLRFGGSEILNLDQSRRTNGSLQKRSLPVVKGDAMIRGRCFGRPVREERMANPTPVSSSNSNQTRETKQ